MDELAPRLKQMDEYLGAVNDFCGRVNKQVAEIMNKDLPVDSNANESIKALTKAK
jgi:hypothetical protein